MATTVSAAQARELIMGEAECAFLDVREAGEFGEAHALLATPLAYSELEARVRTMVPRLVSREMFGVTSSPTQNQLGATPWCRCATPQPDSMRQAR